MWNMKNNMECIYLNHFAVHQKLTQDCKSTLLHYKKVELNPDILKCYVDIFLENSYLEFRKGDFFSF